MLCLIKFGTVFILNMVELKINIMIKQIGVLLVSTSLLVSCVGSKKHKALESDYTVLNNKYAQLQEDLKRCEDDRGKLGSSVANLETLNTNLKQRVANLAEQMDDAKSTNTQVLGNLKDLSVISEKQAESISKSLDKLREKDAYIQDLQSAMAYKDSLNMALVLNLKGALRDVNDQDINIQVEKGVVFISISDKLLFESGRYDLSSKAKTILGKVATVLNNQPNIEFMVEGHTDNVAIKGGALKDNWDLSVLRATSVVRTLQNDFGIKPSRMTAGGRSQYSPVASNDNANGRASNRRTRIVILPELDQFYQLLEPNKTAEKPAK